MWRIFLLMFAILTLNGKAGCPAGKISIDTKMVSQYNLHTTKKETIYVSKKDSFPISIGSYCFYYIGDISITYDGDTVYKSVGSGYSFTALLPIKAGTYKIRTGHSRYYGQWIAIYEIKIDSRHALAPPVHLTNADTNQTAASIPTLVTEPGIFFRTDPEKITISCEESDLADILIHDFSGRLLREFHPDNKKQEFPFSDFIFAGAVVTVRTHSGLLLRKKLFIEPRE